jgi:hypothetical protein
MTDFKKEYLNKIVSCDGDFICDDNIKVNLPISLKKIEIENIICDIIKTEKDIRYMNNLFLEKYELRKYNAMQSAVNVLVENVVN